VTTHDPITSTWTIPLSISIRKLVYSDLAKLEWYGKFKHLRNIFWRSYAGQQDGQRLLLVADCKGFPIGRLFILLNSKNGTLADGHRSAYLYSFQVMDLFQGQGIGTRLLHEAEAILRQRNYERVTIGVAKTNEGALRLYQRHGYAIFGENNAPWSYQDHQNVWRTVDEPSWLMSKSL
jgi:ribosomal protein S18 acetylase RimI-like enzyme